MLCRLLLVPLLLASIVGNAQQRAVMTADTGKALRDQLQGGQYLMSYRPGQGLFLVRKDGAEPFKMDINKINGLQQALNDLTNDLSGRPTLTQIQSLNGDMQILQTNKLDVSTFNNYTSTAGGGGANKLDVSAFQSYTNTASSDLNNKVNTTTFQSYTNTTAGAINGKVAQTTYDNYVQNATISIAAKAAQSYVDGLNTTYMSALSNRTIHASIAQIRAYNGTAKAFFLIDRDKGGIFARDSLDSTSPDDGAVILRDALGRVYKRKFDGYANLAWWNPKGDNNANDSLAVQSAINYVIGAADPRNGELPPYVRNPGTLLCPPGSYSFSDVKVRGSIRILGTGGGTYALPTFVQRREGTNILVIEADKDGRSNSTVIEGIAFKSGSASSNPNVAQIKVKKGIASHSFYVRKSWFKTPERYALDLPQGDDFQFEFNTLDVAPFDWLRLGTDTASVTNARIVGNTFYRTYNAAVRLINVKGLVAANNVFYTNDDGSYNVPQGICFDGLDAYKIEGVTLSNNSINNIPTVIRLPTIAKGVVASGNVANNISKSFLTLFGGGVAYNFAVVGNAVSSSATSNLSDGFINGPGCGLQGSSIMANSFFSGTATALGVNLPDGRVFNNIIDNNAFVNVTTPYTLPSLAQNGQSTLGSVTFTGTPTAGQIPVATGANSVTWQTIPSPNKNVVTVTGNYTATATDDIIIVNSSAATTITLPDPNANIGKVYIVKRTSTGGTALNVTTTITAGRFDNASTSTYSMGTTASKYLIVASQGTNFYQIIGNN